MTNDALQDRYDLVIRCLRERNRKISNQRRDDFMAQCPAHDDNNPSLHVSKLADKIGVHCFSGCHPKAVLEALGLRYGHLFANDGGVDLISSPAAWDAYQAAIRAANQRDKKPATTKPLPDHTHLDKVAHYDYHDADGTTLARKVRYNLVDTDTGEIVGKHFTTHAIIDGRQQPTLNGLQLPIYNLPAIITAIANQQRIYLVEGEKDADRIIAMGFPATTLHSTNAVTPERLAPLTGGTITIIVDRDKTGDTWAAALNDTLTTLGCHTTYRQALTGKDVSDHLDAGHGLAALDPYRFPDTVTDVTTATVNDHDNQPDADTTADLIDTSWRPQRLTARLTTDAGIPAPTILRREGDIHAFAFYPGRVNGIIGESESGKTWLALEAVRQTINNDNQQAMFIDFEDSAAGLGSRLTTLGLNPQQLDNVHYLNPDTGLGLVDRGILLDYIQDINPTLVVVDGQNAAMTLMGLDINSNNDATSFYIRLLKPIADLGPCLIGIDHIPKSKENRSKGPLGAQAKRAMINGCTILVTVTEPPAPGHTGILKLSIDKDRPGQVRATARHGKNWAIATIHGTNHGHVGITLKPLNSDGQDDDETDTGNRRNQRLPEEALMHLIAELRHEHRETDGTQKPATIKDIQAQLRNSGRTAGNVAVADAVRRLKQAKHLDDDGRWLNKYTAPDWAMRTIH